MDCCHSFSERLLRSSSWSTYALSLLCKLCKGSLASNLRQATRDRARSPSLSKGPLEKGYESLQSPKNSYIAIL